MTAQATRTRTNVVYFLQTHGKPAQVARLVQVITEGSPDAIVLISHDVAGAALDGPGLRALGNVHVLLHHGGYGDFSHLDRYLAAVDWLDAKGVDYDWLENLSGQDYPLRAIPEIEDALAATDKDGFLLYSPVFPDRVPAEADQGAGPRYTLVRAIDATMRYDYRQWRLGRPTAAKHHWLRPFQAINYVQPWIRVSSAYASVGVRRRRTVFGPDFHCYGGSFFCTLRVECARYVRDYARANPDVVAYFRTVLAPSIPAGSTSTWTTSATSTGPAARTPIRERSGLGTSTSCLPATRTGRASSTSTGTRSFSRFSTSGSGGARGCRSHGCRPNARTRRPPVAC
jgi:hypothetical protein